MAELKSKKEAAEERNANWAKLTPQQQLEILKWPVLQLIHTRQLQQNHIAGNSQGRAEPELVWEDR
jgi:hypothetical protein